MNAFSFRGTGVAIVTPFQDDLQVDYNQLGRLIEFNIEGGVEYIVSLGTTGEAVTLSSAECRQVLDYTIRKVDGRVPIVAGFFGSNFTEMITKKVQAYNFDGIAAIMSSSPAYVKPSQEGIFRHYMALAEASPLPVILYNVPSRTGSNVLPETVVRIAHETDKIVAVKEASGDLNQAMKILKHRPAHLQVLSGDDVLSLPMIAAGADGVISVIANLYPRTFSDMVRACLSGDLETARRLNDALLDVHPWLYVEGNPVGIKAAMEAKGLCPRSVRLPLCPMSDSNYAQLQKALSKVDVEEVPALAGL